MLAKSRAFEISFARCLNCKLIVSTTDSISSTSTNSFGLNALSLNNIINDVRFCMNPTFVTFGATDSKSNNGIFSLNGCVCIPLPTAAGNNAFNKPSSSFSFSASKQTYDVVTYISPIPLVFGDNALHLIGPFVTFSDGASSKSSHAPPSSMDAFASSAESFARVFHPRTTAWTFFKILIIRCSATASSERVSSSSREEHALSFETPTPDAFRPVPLSDDARSRTSFSFSSSSPPRGVFFDTTTTSSSFGIERSPSSMVLASSSVAQRVVVETLSWTTPPPPPPTALLLPPPPPPRDVDRVVFFFFLLLPMTTTTRVSTIASSTRRMCPLCRNGGKSGATKEKDIFC